MLEANPNLTPNLIKGILQYTAQQYPGYNALRQGAGFVNSLGAVQLARFYATAKSNSKLAMDASWSRQLIWGNHRISGGFINPSSNAWALNVVWGSAKTLVDTGDNIVWGNADGGDNIVWGNSGDGDNIVWGNSDGDNVVWGNDCGGADCANVIWGAVDAGDNIVWGNCNDGDNIVWGNSNDGDNIVWGNSSGADVTWATDAGDDTVLYPDSDPLPSVILDFDVFVPLTTSTVSVSLGGL